MSKSLRDIKPVDGPRLLVSMLNKSEIFDRSLDPVFLTFSGPFAVTGEEIEASTEVTEDLVERVTQAAGSRHHRAAMELEDAMVKRPDE